MAKSFNVKNNSARLVHIGGVSIAPGSVAAVPATETNAVDIQGENYLEVVGGDDDAETETETKTEAPKKAAASGWTAPGKK